MKVGYQSTLAATCPVTMFAHFSIKYSLNTMQNTHKGDFIAVYFTKLCVNDKHNMRKPDTYSTNTTT